MGLLQAAAASFGFYVLLQFVVIPKLTRNISEAKAPNAFSLLAALLIAELARAATLIATASLGLVIGLLWLIPKFASFGSQHQLARGFEFLRHLREQIEHLDKWWGILTIGLLGLALWFAVRREAKHQASKAVETAFEKLKSDAQTNGLPDLPATPEMLAAEAEIEKRRARIEEIASNTSNATSQSDNPELARLISEIETIHTWHTHLDITRRLDVGQAITTKIKPEFGGEKSHPLLLSAGFFKLISSASRALTIASLVLLAPALIAVASGEISDVAQSAIVRVHDLILKQTIKEAEESWSQALASGPEKQELSKADEALIDQLSQQFQTYVQQQNSGLVRGSVEIGRRLVQNSARERILQNFAASKPDAVVVKGAASGRIPQSEVNRYLVGAISSDQSLRNGVSEQFKKELSEQAKHAKPQAWEAFRAKATQALRTAAAPKASELSSKLFAEALNTFGQTVFGTDDASKAFSHLASSLGKPGDIAERYGELQKLNRNRFLSEISTHGSFGSPQAPLVPGTTIPVRNSALESAAKQIAGQLDSRLSNADKLWRDSPPSLERVGREGQNLNAARQQIEKLVAAKTVNPNIVRELPNSLATYADYFPGQLGEEAHTPRASAMKSLPALRSEMED
jgi:hypothetical protein